MAYPYRALGPDSLCCSHQCGFQIIFEVHDRLRAGPQLFEFINVVVHALCACYKYQGIKLVKQRKDGVGIL